MFCWSMLWGLTGAATWPLVHGWRTTRFSFWRCCWLLLLLPLLLSAGTSTWPVCPMVSRFLLTARSAGSLVGAASRQAEPLRTSSSKFLSPWPATPAVKNPTPGRSTTRWSVPAWTRAASTPVREIQGGRWRARKAAGITCRAWPAGATAVPLHAGLESTPRCITWWNGSKTKWPKTRSGPWRLVTAGMCRVLVVGSIKVKRHKLCVILIT